MLSKRNIIRNFVNNTDRPFSSTDVLIDTGLNFHYIKNTMIKLRKEGLVKTIGKEGRSVIYVRATRRVRSEHECDVNTPKARELETKVKKEGYRSLRELAKKLGVSHEYARQVITARKLHDKKVGEYTEEYRQMKKLAQRLVRVLKKLRRDRQRESDRLFRSQIEPFPQDYDPRGGRNAKRIR